MPKPPYDRFVKFPELTTLLKGFAEHFPELLELSSIGKSHEGRDIWLCTVTNRATGPHDEKPAIWIDANIHATELTGSTAALYLIDKLGHGLRQGRAGDQGARHENLLHSSAVGSGRG